MSLPAGIDLQTGEAIPLVSATHNSEGYIEFLKILNVKYPKGDKIRPILDNLKVHTSEETRKYLDTVSGRFEYDSDVSEKVIIGTKVKGQENVYDLYIKK